MEYLAHHGIKGQKWGVRRYQNADGSLTEAGKKRYLDSSGELNAKGKKEVPNYKAPTKKKSVHEMTKEELQEKINRMELEKRYTDLMKSAYPPKKSLINGREIASSILTNSAKKVGEAALTYVIGTAINKAIGEKVVKTVAN